MCKFFKTRELSGRELYPLRDIIRYNNKPKINNESVAEHSFFVAANCLKIMDFYEIKDKTIRLKTLEYAIVHDIPEVVIGDIQYDVKMKIDDHANKQIESVENDSLSDTKFNAYSHIFKEFIEGENSIAKCIVELADGLSVLQFTKQEIEMGNNTHGILEIYEKCQPRIHKKIKDLEKLLDINSKTHYSIYEEEEK